MAKPTTKMDFVSEGKSEPKMVRVFSTRPGSIKIPDGRVLEKGNVLIVNCETAEWLEKSFKGFVKKID